MAKKDIYYFIDKSFINTGTLNFFYNFNNISGESPSTGLWNQKLTVSDGDFSDNCSLFFDFEKSGNGDCILFSNYESGGAYPSGFAIGITDSNSLFFESYDIEGPVVYTSHYNLSQRNLANVQLTDNLVTFNVFSNNLSVNSESFPIDSDYILRSDNWYLGSGENYPMFTGTFYNFLYFNTGLSFESIKSVFSGFAYDVTSGGSGQTVNFSGITGYENVYTYSSGVTGYQLAEIQTPSISNYFYTEELTGILSNITGTVKVPIWTGDCFTDVENGIIYKWIDISGSYTGVTGYNLLSGTTTGYETSYVETPLSGEIENLSGSIPLYGTGSVLSGAETGYTITKNYDYLENLNYNSVLYIGEQYLNSISELTYLQTGLKGGTYNQDSIFNFGYEEFDMIDNTSSGENTFFLNGQFFVESGFGDSGTIYAPSLFLNEDYWLEDGKIANTIGFAEENDFGIHDFREITFKKYTRTSSFSNTGVVGFVNGYLPDINIETGDYVFLNGQKLIENYDFKNETGIYYDTGILEAGDDVFVYKLSEPKNRETGSFNYTGILYIIDSLEYYLNGVRQKNEMFIQHSHQNSLLTNQNAYLSKTGVIYNNEQTFFE